MASKLQRWEKRTTKLQSTIDPKAFQEAVPEARRKRTKKHHKVTESEILDIAYRVLIDKE